YQFLLVFSSSFFSVFLFTDMLLCLFYSLSLHDALPISTGPTTLSAAQVVVHARFSEPGIDKSSALMLLFFVAGWLAEWNGRAVVADAHFEAWQHGPTDPTAHARFADTMPKRLKLPD